MRGKRIFKSLWLVLRLPEPCFIPIILLLFILVPNCGQRGDKGPGLPVGGQEEGIPKPEHPRPDFQRDQWKNLNGVWAFSTDPEDLGEALTLVGNLGKPG